MKPKGSLEKALKRIDGKGYGAYKSTKGAYDFGAFAFHIDYVQGDPYAAPSRIRLVIPKEVIELPEDLLTRAVRRVAVADYLNRQLARALASASRPRGSGKSGRIGILQPRQQVLERTSLRVDEDGRVIVRLTAGLPARGRRILARGAIEMLLDDIPAAVENSILPGALDVDSLRAHTLLIEDSVTLRAQLRERSLVAFIPEGAILPRRSGIDDRPLSKERAVPFQPPESLTVSLEAPNRGIVKGLGIPEGITLIVGGGYHGKSTLLRAVELGVYDHIEGDGRELAVTVPGAVKVRAEDGRCVAGVDISNFITDLPGGEDTRHFSTENASGSTSQAAAIAEALEVGATCLLIDEDTSATNFMIRDARMQALIHDRDEPITPFIDRARQMYEELGTSTVIVVGGAGDYFDVADTVIGMKAYVPHDLSDDARRIASEFHTQRSHEGGPWSTLRPRIPQPDSIDPRKGKRPVSIKVPNRDRVLFGTEELNVSAVEQLVELAQVRAIAQAIVYGKGQWIDGRRTVREALEGLRAEIEGQGLDVIDDRQMGDYADFRIFELVASLGRLRSLRVDTGMG